MKILFVCHEMDPVLGGGIAERTLQLARFVAEQGNEATILTLDPDARGIESGTIGKIAIMKARCMGRRYYVPLISRAELDVLVAGFDAVHLISHWTVLNLLACFSCRKLGKPYLVSPAGALKVFGRSILLKRIYNALVGNALVRRANACIAITEAETEDFIKLGVQPDRITVIPNGIDRSQYAAGERPCDAIALRRKWGIGQAPFIFFIGRLNPIKGPDILLDAFLSIAARYPDMHLVFAGPDGGALPALQAAANNSPCAGRVHFVGFVVGDEKAMAIGASTLVAIPSRHEAMSIVVLEAGILGVPVLLSDQCGLNFLHQARAGHVCAANAAAFAAALASMLGNAETLEASGNNLKKIVIEKYQWQSSARQLVDLCRQGL